MNFPCILQRFRNLPGEYGTLQVNALSPEAIELRLTGEYLQLNRDDAQEMIRVLSLWLAAQEPEPQVVHTHGRGSTVVVEDDGPGTPIIEIRENVPPANAVHFDRQEPPRRPPR